MAPNPNFGPGQGTSSHQSWNTVSQLISLALKILLLISVSVANNGMLQTPYYQLFTQESYANMDWKSQ